MISKPSVPGNLISYCVDEDKINWDELEKSNYDNWRRANEQVKLGTHGGDARIKRDNQQIRETSGQQVVGDIYYSHMAINYITGRVCESCNFHGSFMIPIQEPMKEQIFAGKIVKILSKLC